MLNENQLKLLRHLSRFNLLDYPSCLDMLNNDGGSDRTVLSYAFRPLTKIPAYSAAKAAVSNFTQWLAVHFAPVGIRVNAIAPGWIDTGAYHDPAYRPDYTRADAAQHPSGRVGTPQDIFRAVLFLSDGENSFIDGETLTVDGGMTRRMIYTGDEGWAYTV